MGAAGVVAVVVQEAQHAQPAVRFCLDPGHKVFEREDLPRSGIRRSAHVPRICIEESVVPWGVNIYVRLRLKPSDKLRS